MFKFIINHAPAIYIGLLGVGVAYCIVNKDTQDRLGNSINSQLAPRTHLIAQR